MLFHSFKFFLLFLPLVVVVYFLLNRWGTKRQAKIFLILASLFFYSWWNINYLPLILLSMLANYRLGFLLSRSESSDITSRKIILILGLVGNIGFLAYFKYSDFFIQNYNGLFNSEFPLLHLPLPLAISFFTFQQIAYLVDAFRYETRQYNLVDYSLFVAFFPQLIAGPIVTHNEMITQFENANKTKVNYHNLTLGMFLFSIGLFKKVMLADHFMVWADRGFDNAASLEFFSAWVTSLSFTLQIYFDYSGYIDMAMGAAIMFNIHLPINFNSPYKVTSAKDFWLSWNITLSRFLKKYIYIPLGGNRHGTLLTYRNLLITFLIGGFWHGAEWSYVFWGLLFSMGLVINHAWKLLGFKLHRLLAWFLAFQFINLTMIFFRAREWGDVLKIVKGMVGLNGAVLPEILKNYELELSHAAIRYGDFLLDINADYISVLMIMACLSIVLLAKNSNQFKDEFQLNVRTAILAGVLFALGVMSLHQTNEFLYFVF